MTTLPASNGSRHNGSVAMVTGGSDGVGRAIAARLHQEGACVAICGRRPDQLERAVDQMAPVGSDRLLATPADCSVAQDLERFHRETVGRFGAVDILVNNVGTSLIGAFTDLTDAEWQYDLDLKLMSAVRLSRMVVAPLVESGTGGRIVNVLSIGGKNPGAGGAPSAVTRAAGLALTKVLSRELASHAITVNALCIGTVESGQHERRRQMGRESLEDYYRRLVRERRIPAGRVGRPEEVAGLVAFLTSIEGAYISGTAINVDGGASPSL